ncbi:GNAT family N-acetyltransferase [Helicovermis profundi]|uniref:GNAT family N-acetyltransferase n=1 Tax=Helicovermis profundi TaxID=3065157 RepID=A0AAU9EJY1_9FIRM|nr:GNAT family N-acetyltransferase [Clostridia bacterium S502]
MKKIETQRCIIRTFLEEDINDFMIYRNNEEWMIYQGFKGLSKEEYQEILMKEFSLNDGVQLAIEEKSNKHLIGDIYLKQCEDEFWIGYTINPIYARQGYAFEAAKGIMEWIKYTGGKKIYAGVLPENIASIELLKKLGFKYTETEEDGEKIYFIKV